MAEIKSTLEMVLARAEKLAASATDHVGDEEQERTGMRLAAEYLKEGIANLEQALSEQSGPSQMAVRAGMAKTLLRNIVLPRDELLRETGKTAIKGLLAISGKSREMEAICKELSQILDQYNQHKEQMTKQLEDAIQAQLQQRNPMGEGGDSLNGQAKLNPALHPQYREELGRMLTSLNNQYNDAMDQRKEMIRQRFSGGSR
jgi:hypothetical protein